MHQPTHWFSNLTLCALTLAGAVVAQDVLDPGLTCTGCRAPRANLAIAQVFQPTQAGIVTQIRHGLDNTAGNLAGFNIYVTPATGGTPPANYSTPGVALFAKTGATGFSSGSQCINGLVSTGAGFTVRPSQQYALIFERPGPGTLTCRQTSGGGAYSAGDGYVLTSGGAWVTTGGCSSNRHDLAFELLGTAAKVPIGSGCGIDLDSNLAVLGSVLDLTTTNLDPASPIAVTCLSFGEANILLLPTTCRIYIGPTQACLVSTSVGGTAVVSLPIPNGSGVSTQFFAQSVGLTMGNPLGFETSNGLRVTVIE